MVGSLAESTKMDRAMPAELPLDFCLPHAVKNIIQCLPAHRNSTFNSDKRQYPGTLVQLFISGGQSSSDMGQIF